MRDGIRNQIMFILYAGSQCLGAKIVKQCETPVFHQLEQVEAAVHCLVPEQMTSYEHKAMHRERKHIVRHPRDPQETNLGLGFRHVC